MRQPPLVCTAVMSQAYRDLMFGWLSRGHALRYSGSMVPDVHHILTKGEGVFCYGASSASPSKLRLVFECAPVAFVVEVRRWRWLLVPLEGRLPSW